MSKNQSNLVSPKTITEACDLTGLKKWFLKELKSIPNYHEQELLKTVIDHVEDFVKFPNEAILMWESCDRIVPKDKKTKYHTYPTKLKEALRAKGIRTPDARINGPAVAAYLFAGGERPQRFGSNNSWHIHHLYSGKFPYINKNETLHAVKDGLHFTQSAGLIATHPIVDQMCDEYPFFSWFLRAMAFKKFGYDPDKVFSGAKHDQYGFACKTSHILQPKTTSK